MAIYGLKTRLLVTGGSGFIGTNVIDYYLGKTNYVVLNIDIAAPVHSGYTSVWKQVDLLDHIMLSSVLEDFDPHYVLHLGARTDLAGRHIDDYAANVAGVRNLIAATKKSPSLRRVIFASSMLVCKVGYSPSSPNDYCPINPYGESKAVGEKLVHSSHLDYSWAIVRPTSIWGPWFKEPYRNFFDYVLSGKYFHIGNSCVKKTYGFVGNVVCQLDALLQADCALIDRQVFYLGDSSSYVIRDWADAIARKEDINISTVPNIVAQGGALMGDFLKVFGLRFPLTSFRLKNMTTENCVDLQPIFRIVPDLSFTQEQAIDLTLSWLKGHP